MAISHADCTHPRTPAGRRACRTGNTPTVVKTPQKPPAAPRIQPRRSGARVRIDASGCIQAALHTVGRCACGWHEEKFCNTKVWACAGH